MQSRVEIRAIVTFFLNASLTLPFPIAGPFLLLERRLEEV